MEYPEENKGIRFEDLSDQALHAEHNYWEHKVVSATSWGASLGFANSCLEFCKREMKRRGLLS